MTGIQKHALPSPALFFKPERTENLSGIDHMKAIIVDDDPNSHTVLKNLLSQNHPEVDVLASGFTVTEGYELVKAHQPDLLFLDIELPDGLGFKLLKDLETVDFYLIFITAFVEYAVTAIKFGGLDYLIKPIDREQLADALEIVRNRIKSNREKQMLIVRETLDRYPEGRLPTRMALASIEEIVYIEIESIVRMEGAGPSTLFFLHTDPKRYVASHNLGYYEKAFQNYSRFMKVHRSHIINLGMVKKYVKVDGGYVVMKNGDSVPVSNRYRDELKRRLDDFNLF